MADSLRDYYEWLRIRLGVLTPLTQGIEGARAGDEPEWQPDPNNYKLRNTIRTACRIANQHIHLAGTGNFRDLPVDAQTADAPLSVYLGGITGWSDRKLNSVRRAWWWDGTTAQRLDPVVVGNLDARQDAYISESPAVPRRFWIEGYNLFLSPPPASAGWLRYMASAGILMPDAEEEGFDGIPSDYDPCLLYVALVELGKMMPADAEMTARAQAFTSDAAAGLERLGAWFHGGANEEAPAQTMFDARWMRRGRIRR